MLKNLVSALGDALRLVLPVRKSKKYAFAFIIHPRSLDDVYIKFGLFRYLPESVVLLICKSFWPITMSRVTGLKSNLSGADVPGWVISIPLTAKQIMEDKQAALTHILRAMYLARSRGATIVGLGALISSVTRRGLDLLDSGVFVTTGHAYTVCNVTQTLLKAMEQVRKPVESSVVAIVGASGSIGSGCAQTLARHTFKKMLLIDVIRKNDDLVSLVAEIERINPELDIEVSHQVKDIKQADCIITATNTPEALVIADDLKAGAIVVDDAQPSDIHESVYTRDDVLVLEAGAVHTPGISSHLRLGLKNKYDNFSCLAELLVLASNEHSGHYAVGRTTQAQVQEMGERGAALGFTTAEFQNEHEAVTSHRIEKIRSILNT